MTKYPRAFGICTPDGWWEILYEDSHTANLDANHKYEAGDFAGCEVVELIPLPEHEALVAAERKAERERLMKMVTPLTVLQDVIREVPS